LTLSVNAQSAATADLSGAVETPPLVGKVQEVIGKSDKNAYKAVPGALVYKWVVMDESENVLRRQTTLKDLRPGLQDSKARRTCISRLGTGIGKSR
jgi:hypothetical protein